MSENGEKQRQETRRLSRSVWAAAILVGAAVLAWGALELTDTLGGRLIIQEGVALAVFLVLTVAAVAWSDRRADSDAPTVGSQISAVATVIGLGVLVLAALRIAGAVSPPPAVGCINTSGPDHTTVAVAQAVTYKQPTVNSDATGLLILGCRLQFDGFCVGDNVKDQIGEILDARWWHLSDGQGYLPGAMSAGPPPSDDKPRSDCPSPKRQPAVITATGILDTKRGSIKLLARARDTAIIGFAVKDGDGWRRVGWDIAPADRQPVTLSVRPGLLPTAEFRAVPCVGYHQPVGQSKAIVVRRGDAGPAGDPFNPKQPRSQDSMDAACNLPTTRPGK